MKVVVEIEIEKPKEAVWSAITDIQNSSKMISGIINLNILDKPDEGIVGLKWEETRLMFGKEASETMWITDSAKNKYYCTRAESHGSVYITKLSLKESGGNTVLIMLFTAEAQGFFMKSISAVMGGFIKKSMKKLLYKDLEDIKKFVEKT